jgi:hypothetical protein
MVPPYRPFCDQESDANFLKWLALASDEFMYHTRVIMVVASSGGVI